MKSLDLSIHPYTKAQFLSVALFVRPCISPTTRPISNLSTVLERSCHPDKEKQCSKTIGGKNIFRFFLHPKFEKFQTSLVDEAEGRDAYVGRRPSEGEALATRGESAVGTPRRVYSKTRKFTSRASEYLCSWP